MRVQAAPGVSSIPLSGLPRDSVKLSRSAVQRWWPPSGGSSSADELPAGPVPRSTVSNIRSRSERACSSPGAAPRFKMEAAPTDVDVEHSTSQPVVHRTAGAMALGQGLQVVQAEEAYAFGLMLRRYRVAADMSEEALAERASLSQRGIADLEPGGRRFPFRHTVRRLADALGHRAHPAYHQPPQAIPSRRYPLRQACPHHLAVLVLATVLLGSDL